ncbi:helix-turn-helix domain-containing protein [Rhizobium giardinii]
MSELGLHEVDDPGIGKPVYRKPFGGKITLSAELEEQISASLRGARDRRELPRAKLSRLLGLSEQVYVRYEKHVSRLTVGRLIHLCEVLGAAPEEIIAPAAIHLWGETETKADLLLASIEKLRTFDEETLRDVFSLLGRLDGSDQSDHSRNGAASAAPLLSRAADHLE